MQHKDVPFFANTPDDTHCFQASIKSILKYYIPEKDFTWRDLEKLSCKVEGKATWPQAMLYNLIKMGFDVVVIEGFDGRRFIDEGANYLITTFGKEAATWQIENSDIEQERKIYKDLLESGANITLGIPVVDDILRMLDQGYLIQVTINSRKLNNKKGYTGHSVVIFGYNKTGLFIHDPGLPPVENRFVTLDMFEAAWADPNDTAKNLIAIKMNKKG